MTWSYSQASGHLDHDGARVAVGYSGTGEGRNNPAKQDVHNVGPLPQGRYTIGAPHDTASHGPFVMALSPSADTNEFGRAGFLIHGDNSRHDASQGCIILDRPTREKVWASGDRALVVTA